MVINHLEKLFVTSDASTIVTELDVNHPAAKLLVMAAKAQAAEVGDGTNLVRRGAARAAGRRPERLQSCQLRCGGRPRPGSQRAAGDAFSRARAAAARCPLPVWRLPASARLTLPAPALPSRHRCCHWRASCWATRRACCARGCTPLRSRTATRRRSTRCGAAAVALCITNSSRPSPSSGCLPVTGPAQQRPRAAQRWPQLCSSQQE